MISAIRRRMPSRTIAFLLVLLCVAAAASAGSDYGSESFAVRLPPAFIRFTEVSAIGGETVANRFSSAINPASTAWTDLASKYGIVVAPYYSLINFDNGTDLHLTGQSVTWDTGKFGVFQPVVSQIRSNEDTLRTGLDFDYDVDTFQLQWGKRFGRCAIGATFNFARARIIQDGTIMRTVAPFPSPLPVTVYSEGNAESYRFRLGGLYEVADKWLAGMIVEYAFQPWRSDVTTTTTLPGELPPSITRARNSGTQHQVLVRPGISYEYAERSTVYLDYAYGGYLRHDDALHSHRFSLGVDHQLLQWLFVRAAGSVDDRGNVGVTCGASVFFSRWGSLEFGYQYNMLPELQPEFGRAHALQFTLAIRL